MRNSADPAHAASMAMVCAAIHRRRMHHKPAMTQTALVAFKLAFSAGASMGMRASRRLARRHVEQPSSVAGEPRDRLGIERVIIAANLAGRIDQHEPRAV